MAGTDIGPIQMEVSKQPGQRSLGYDSAYLARFVPTWNSPTYGADAWRRVVASQPVAMTCKETLVANILALDWKIIVKDSNLQDELAGTVRHYTNLFEKAGYGMDLDYTSHIEWIVEDLLDTPFGGASEIGRKDDNPTGRVQWIKPLDSANLYPTMNFDYPVVESYLGKIVAFPKYAIVRTFMSPVKKIERQGWGIAPPEKIYMALQMLSQGDVYYAGLLLDVPSAGILDLGDMEKEAAQEWVKAYQTMLVNGGQGSFKIPVLYEHNNKIEFVSLGKVPNDIMFDRIIGKYAALVCAGYGMTLSDIGLTNGTTGGDTLAGSIRSDRKTRKTGFARLKKKIAYYFNQILPPTLKFHWIDYDDELNVSLGRARLANATAWGQYIDKKIFTPEEARAQTVADGLVTINVTETIDETKTLDVPVKAPERPGMLGAPVSPSMGGYGEIKSISKSKLNKFVEKICVSVQPIFETLQEVYPKGNDDSFIPRTSIERSISGSGAFDFRELLHGVYLTKTELDDVIKKAIILELTDEMFPEEYENDETWMFESDGVDTQDARSYDDIVSLLKTKVFNSVSEFLNMNGE